MSQENLEIVTRVWEAFERFDFPAEAFADDVEWHTARDLPDRETCRGTAAVQRMLAEGWGTVVDPGCEAEEVIEAGEYVVVRWRAWGKARASGVPVDWREAHVYGLRDGRIVEVREFRTPEEALEAVGLPK